ncbi:MAG: TOTE conflict system archaeo-eukaryotic primase domain-containing protein [Pyrinomonadaceae bacterium]
MPAPFYEFDGNKRLLWIAEEWMRYADDLAEWAMERLVNRRDVWSQYTLKDGKVRVFMLPVPERRKLGTDMVTITKLHRHFQAKSVAHLIGLFSISDHSTCKWFAVDVDLHDELVPNAGEIAEANFAAALEWAEKLRSQGMDPLLLDSNGVGGYHVWILFDKEYPLADVFDFADSLRLDWDRLKLPRKPEIFPPKRVVAPNDLPYTLRVPGRHHTRHFYTRVWNFDAFGGENEWLEGGDAIEAMLSTRPSKLPKKTKAAKKSTLVPAPLPKTREPVARKPRVCLDLDGVLAQYDKWRGVEHIGDPISGALKFTKDLAKIAEIVVFTSRCAQDIAENSRITPGQLRIHVIEWLEKHKFPYSDVYVGQGKPRAAAFIDDRAVSCSPQNDKDAFANALKATKVLVTKPHGLPKKFVSRSED